MRRAAVMLAALAWLALAGCGGSEGARTAPARHAAASRGAVPTPTVRFTGPKVVHAGSPIKVLVVLGHFQMAPNMVGMAPVPGKGHLHFMLAGGRFDYPRYSGANGVLGKKLGVAGAYSPALSPRITYSHLPPGRYTLVCMLANNNHTPTGVEAKQTIVVR
ncbi:MAG TPA: hypothetical protein VF032_14045 [Thermoleophilaceae bacterium]